MSAPIMSAALKHEVIIARAKWLAQYLETYVLEHRELSVERASRMYSNVSIDRSTRRAQMDYFFGPERSAERIAAERAVQKIISESDLKVIQWRMEWKARAWASAIVQAKRGDIEGFYAFNTIYNNAFTDIKAFAMRISPMNPDVALYFAQPIMDEAELAVRDYRRELLGRVRSY